MEAWRLTFGVYAKSCAGTILPQGTHQCKFWASDSPVYLIGERAVYTPVVRRIIAKPRIRRI